MLTEARDINDAGQVVVSGQLGARRRAFLLSPLRAATDEDTPAGGTLPEERPVGLPP